jgi:hypothetical protein
MKGDATMISRSELKSRILSDVLCPYEEIDYTPISLYDATIWLADIWRDQNLSDIPEDKRIPHDTIPAVFMDVWNEICLDRIRSEAASDGVPVVSAFISKHGIPVIIQQYGTDDYCAVWYDSCSVRGTLLDIIRELKDEI